MCKRQQKIQTSMFTPMYKIKKKIHGITKMLHGFARKVCYFPFFREDMTYCSFLLHHLNISTLFLKQTIKNTYLKPPLIDVTCFIA